MITKAIDYSEIENQTSIEFVEHIKNELSANPLVKDAPIKNLRIRQLNECYWLYVFTAGVFFSFFYNKKHDTILSKYIHAADLDVFCEMFEEVLPN